MNKPAHNPFGAPPETPVKIDGRSLRSKKPPGMRETFTAMWKDGTSSKAIMRHFGVSKSTLRVWRAQLGLPARWEKHTPNSEPRKTEIKVWFRKSEHSRAAMRAMQKNQSLSTYIRSLVLRDIGA